MADDRSDRGNGSRRRGRNGPAIARSVKEELEELTGRPADMVSAMMRTDDGWQFRVEMVELEKVPPTTNVMGTYEVETDDGGEIKGYELIRRYHRGQTNEEE